MARTKEDSPTFTFTFTNGTALSVKSNFATSGKGFFSTTTAIERVPGTLLVISTGTTAPFSAICGASMRMSFDSAGAPTPRLFSASAALFAPNASLFQAASARSGRSSRPSAARVFLRNSFIVLFYLALVAPGLAARLFLEADLADRHAAVGRLHHVVDGEQAHRRRGERLHLHAGAAAALRGRDERDLAPCRVERKLGRDARKRDRVRERNERRGLLRRLDRGEARHAEHVAFLRAALNDGAEGGRPHRDA